MNPFSLLNQLDSVIPTDITGTVLETSGTTIRVSGFPAPVGALAEIRLGSSSCCGIYGWFYLSQRHCC